MRLTIFVNDNHYSYGRGALLLLGAITVTFREIRERRISGQCLLFGQDQAQTLGGLLDNLAKDFMAEETA